MSFGRSPLNHLRSILAFALVLWCAGAGCVISSCAHAASMDAVPHPESSSGAANWGDVSASAGAHGCCHSRHHAIARGRHAALKPDDPFSLAHSSLPESPGSSGATSCCPLISGTFLSAARYGVDRETATVLSASPAAIIVASRAKFAAPPQPTHLPNQAQSHLFNCVFLI